MRGELPADPNALRKIVREQDEKIEKLIHRIGELEDHLVKLRRMHFGPKAERIPEEQLLLFAGERETAPEHTKEEPLPRRRKPPRGRHVIPSELPRRVTVEEIPEEERPCPDCDEVRQEFGQEEIRRLEYEPASFFQDVRIIKKYACRPCQGYVIAKTPAGPLGPIERGMPGPGLIAHILVSKFGDHIPLYRQEGIYRRHGVEVSRSTMGGWVERATELLRPVYLETRKDVLSSDTLQTDDTVVRLLVPGQKKSRQARLWAYRGDREHSQVFFEFSPTREQKYPHATLADFEGCIQCDAYPGYSKLFAEGSGRTELACWAHARRYFFEAEPTDPDRAARAMILIRRLYKIEEKARELSPEERLAMREAESVPVLSDIRGFLEAESLNVLPQSAVGKAIRYSLSQWEALVRYAHIGEADIDNNAVERELRAVAVGRKNFLFFGSEAGGEWGAVAYTLISSCKRNDVEPWAYLKDVLMRVWTHPASRVRELMPRLWRPSFVKASENRPPPGADSS